MSVLSSRSWSRASTGRCGRILVGSGWCCRGTKLTNNPWGSKPSSGCRCWLGFYFRRRREDLHRLEILSCRLPSSVPEARGRMPSWRNHRRESLSWWQPSPGWWRYLLRRWCRTRGWCCSSSTSRPWPRSSGWWAAAPGSSCCRFRGWWKRWAIESWFRSGFRWSPSPAFEKILGSQILKRGS